MRTLEIQLHMNDNQSIIVGFLEQNFKDNSLTLFGVFNEEFDKSI